MALVPDTLVEAVGEFLDLKNIITSTLLKEKLTGAIARIEFLSEEYEKYLENKV